MAGDETPTTMLEVEVPAGLRGGDVLTVQSGSTFFEVIIPNGLASGDAFLVECPADDNAGGGGGGSSSSSSSVEVTVPDGVKAGELFSVQLADGTLVDVIVPDGVQSGDTMAVEVPSAAEADADAAATSPSSSSPSSSSPSSMMAPLLESLPYLPVGGAAAPAAEPASPPSKSSSATLANTTPPSGSTRSGGSRFGDRFGAGGAAKQHQPHFAAGGWLATGGRAPSSPGGASPGPSPSRGGAAPAPEVLLCRTDALRAPRAEEGCLYYKGQFVQILRTSGEWCNAVVIELMSHGFETMYRCRLGEGILEKLISEDEMREPRPDEGFQYCRGQVMQIERPTGLLELCTITGCSMDKSRPHRHEPYYSCRLHPSATTPTSVSETVHEEDLRVPTPQAGCAYYVGQLLQAKRSDGSWNTLVRVVAFERVGYSLGYRCHVEEVLTRGASW